MKATLIGMGAMSMVLCGCTGSILGDADETAAAGAQGGGAGSGQSSAPTAPTPEECATRALTAAPSPLRRLTRREYDNTVRDLLGDDSSPASLFVVDAVVGWFESNAEAPITSTVATQYETAARALAERAVTANLDTLLPCDPAAGEDECAAAFVAQFGKRAYRRPLTPSESSRLSGLYSGERARGGDFASGVRVALAAMLTSPNFLNHVERGVPAAGNPAVQLLTNYELASRLSYFLWATAPDAELFATADSGSLGQAAEIERQVRRMLQDTRVKQGVGGFFDQWLELDKLMLANKTEAFPEWTDELREQAGQETQRFIEHVLWEGDGRLATLLTASFSFVSPQLATLYGVAAPAGQGLLRVELDAARRSGLLTQVSFLARTAYADQTSPVHRGRFVRERLLCQDIPPPPQGVDVSVPVVDPTLTTRQRFAAHSEDPYCAGCHQLMDPIGLGFEHYDPIGRYRETENGLAIDASATVVASRDADGAFTSVVELGDRLAKSSEVADCMVSEWLTFAVGQADPQLQACSRHALGRRFAESGGSLPDLIVAVASSDAFRHRKSYVKEACQ